MIGRVVSSVYCVPSHLDTIYNGGGDAIQPSALCQAAGSFKPLPHLQTRHARRGKISELMNQCLGPLHTCRRCLTMLYNMQLFPPPYRKHLLVFKTPLPG